MEIMTPELYEEKRNALVALMNETLTDCVDLDEGTRLELENTLTKLKRNSFEIVLVGEFQGGKSTVFDTICEGREISPRGIGIKTSACKISAASLPQEQEEYAEVYWKRDRELLLTMYGIIDRHLADNPEKRELFRRDDLGKFIRDLNDPELFQFAKQCIDKEWDIYEASPAAYDPKSEGKLDLLQISTLILRYYRDEELTKMRQITQASIGDISRWVVFPQDWAPRWTAGKRNTTFQFSEIIFVFLSRVFCHIHCKNLERLGCTITDCPGLFAGPWDTEVANQAMFNADAILYLIGGTRSITSGDLNALKKIQLTNQTHKLFFAINARQSQDTVCNQFRPVNIAELEKLGLTLESAESLYVFHGRLAFNAKAKEVSTEPKKWRREVSADLGLYLDLDPYDDEDRVKIDTLCQDADNLLETTGFVCLIQNIELSIVSKKFESILISNGTSKTSLALSKLSGDLRSLENAAKQNSDECQQEANEARKLLEDFQNDVRNLVDSNLKDANLAKALAQNFIYEVFTKNTDQIAGQITERIKALFTHSETLASLVWDIIKKKNNEESEDFDEKSKLEQQVANDVKEALLDVMEPAAEGWLINVRNGENIMFQQTYVSALTRIRKEIQLLWDYKYTGTQNLLDDLALDFSEWEMSLKDDLNIVNDPKYSLDIHGDLVRVFISRVITSLLPIAFGIIALLPITVLFGILPGLVIAVPALIIGMSAKEAIDKIIISHLGKIQDPLRLKLKEYFASPKERGLLTEKVSSFIEDIVENLTQACQRSLDKQYAAFETRAKLKEDLKKKAFAEQQRIAEKCNQVRVKQIDPAREKIAQFTAELEPFFQR